jgi:hypothetical protein
MLNATPYLFLEAILPDVRERGDNTSLTHAQHLLYLFLIALLADVREKG